MLKKIALGALLTGLVAVLIWGAVNRTNAVSGQAFGEGGRHGQAAGYGTGEAVAQGTGGRWSDPVQGANGGNGGSRWGQATGGRGALDGSGNLAPLGVPQADTRPQDWVTLQGSVVSAADDLVEIQIASGEIIPFEGQPLRFAAGQGFSLRVGDAVSVSGFDEDGEFKIGKITNLGNGASVTLRDETGRPGWAGRGRRG